jgi:hypothetical protein
MQPAGWEASRLPAVAAQQERSIEGEGSGMRQLLFYPLLTGRSSARVPPPAPLPCRSLPPSNLHGALNLPLIRHCLQPSRPSRCHNPMRAGRPCLPHHPQHHASFLCTRACMSKCERGCMQKRRRGGEKGNVRRLRGATKGKGLPDCCAALPQPGSLSHLWPGGGVQRKSPVTQSAVRAQVGTS